MKITGDQKYNQIVTAGRQLFWKYGIKRVPIEEICREAGVSKMTFYKHFDNKLDLVRHIIDQITNEGMLKYRKIMDQKIPFREKVRKSVHLKMEQTDEMSSEFYNDYLIHSDPELSAYLNTKMTEVIQIILKDYIIAQQRGDIRKDIRPEFIIYFLNQMMNMAKDEELLQMYKSPQELIMEITNFFFYGIMARNE